MKSRYWAIQRVLRGLNVLGKTDGMIVELTATALAEHDRYAATIATTGGVYETKTVSGSVMYRPRPEVALASDAWRRAFTGLVQLGLTPAARTRVETLPTPTPSR